MSHSKEAHSLATAARSRKNARVLAVTLAIAFTLVVGRLWVLTMLPEDRVLARAQAQLHRSERSEGRGLTEQPGRGGIYDRRGRPLAVSYYEHDLVLDPLSMIGVEPDKRPSHRSEWLMKALQRIDERVSKVAGLLSDAGVAITKERLRVRLIWSLTGGREGGPKRWMRVAERLSPMEYRRVSEALERAKIRGFSFEHRIRREYPYGALCSQMVGVIGESPLDAPERDAGRAGMEWAADRAIEGQKGRLHAEADRLGRELLLDLDQVQRTRPGVDLTLTLDAEVQRFCFEALAKACPAVGASRASAVVLSAKDGELLAACTWPSADPERLDREGEIGKLRLGALLDRFEPGSVIKPVFVSWALQHGKISMSSVFDCGGPDGVHAFGPRVVTEYIANPNPLTTEMILVKSSNVGAVRIGIDALGLDGMYDALQAFRIANHPALGYPASVRGTFTKRRDATVHWTGISLCQGYEIMLSPFGLARLYLVLARGGEFVEPAVLKEIRGQGQRETTPPVTERGRARILDREVADSVRSALERAVEEGTGKSARSDRWSVAAKTGTPRFMNTALYNPVMCAMAPVAARSPEIVVVVQFKDVPNRGPRTYTGGTVAGPVVKEIVERTLNYLGIPEEPGRDSKNGEIR